jgi:hypothetical protein
MKKELQDLYIQRGFPAEKIPGAVEADPASGIEAAISEADLPVLDENGPDAIAKAYQENPEKVLDIYRSVTAKPITKEEFEQYLNLAKNIAEDPKAFEPESDFVPKVYDLSAFQKYLKYNYINVQSEIDQHKYEEVGDWFGWFFWAGGPWVLSKVGLEPKKYPFPFHTTSSPYIYNFKDKNGTALNGKPIRIALFSDFGTGAYHSRYIAAQIDALSPDYAIHLGDVYYAGREHEFQQNLEVQIQPLLSKMQVFTMNSNHEMLSKGEHYFKYLQKKKALKQDQEGSYFCIRSDRYQVIGLDTAYHEDGRHNNPILAQWFAARMKEGTEKKLITILLTPNEAYELGTEGTTKLYKEDIKQQIGNGKIFLWFWGNTHYCTFFDEAKDQTPFYASCIGHAGFPVERDKIVHKKAQNDKIAQGFKPPAKWVDTTYRFNEDIRPDLANSGFVLLTLEKDSVKLQYLDWLDRPDMPEFILKLPA